MMQAHAEATFRTGRSRVTPMRVYAVRRLSWLQPEVSRLYSVQSVPSPLYLSYPRDSSSYARNGPVTAEHEEEGILRFQRFARSGALSLTLRELVLPTAPDEYPEGETGHE